MGLNISYITRIYVTSYEWSLIIPRNHGILNKDVPENEYIKQRIEMEVVSR